MKNKEHLNERSTVAKLLHLIQLSKEVTVLNFYRNSLTEKERELERGNRQESDMFLCPARRFL